MEMPYVIHGGLSDDPLLSSEIEFPELQGHRIEPLLSSDIELPKPQGHRVKPEQFSRKTAPEHLKEAKKALADLEAVKKILMRSGSLAYALKAVRARTLKAAAILKRLTMTPQYRDLIGTSLFKLFQQSQAIANAWNIPIKVK